MAKIVLKVGDDVSTDVIYPGRYMATVLPAETPQFAFADYTEFNGKLRAKQIPHGSVILAGKNFGCGSSREQAASTLKGHNLTIVAKSVARIFLQNAINVGLKVFIVPGMEGSEGDGIEFGQDVVANRTTGETYHIEQLPKARQLIVDAGGLVPYTKKRLMQNAGRTTEQK
jgi:3-isopropylmalate dehydratase small subunit